MCPALRFIVVCKNHLQRAPAQCSRFARGVKTRRQPEPHRLSLCPSVFGALLPSPKRNNEQQQRTQVFPNLADAKEPVRLAANGVLNACRAAYPPNQLCSSLCPRVLELPPGRARTGLLEFLAVLVPHSAGFFLQGNQGNHHPAGGGGGGGGHLQSLTQRIAAALIQSPPPANWDGGLGGDGPTSAGPAASAGIRLLTALFRLDRDALAAASAGLPPDSAVAVRRALSFCRSPSPSSLPVGKAGVAGGASPETTAGVAESDVVAAGEGSSPIRSSGAVLQEQEGGAAVTPLARGGGQVEFGGEVGRSPVGSEERSPYSSPVAVAATAVASPAARGTPVSSTPGSATLCGERDERRGRVEAKSALLTPPLHHHHHQQQQQKPQRQPLAPVTPRDTNREAGERNGKPTKNNTSPAPVSARKNLHAAAVTPASTLVETAKPNTEERRAAEVAAVAQRLIAGLSRGARSHQKVEALSSLRRLADGEGAGARPGFWPRYFGQVLVLLLEGAGAAPAGDSGGSGSGSGSLSSSPSRRRVLLRAKHLQGVRCLVARRGELFPESTETVVGRLVEIGASAGGASCLAVRGEAEACLADLAGVLDPARYLEVLTPLLAFHGATGEATTTGAADDDRNALAELQSKVSVKAQCFVLGALRALTPRLSSPTLLGALGAGPLLAGLETALSGRDLEARKRAVLALVEMYQVCIVLWTMMLRGMSTCIYIYI